jgi:hypothetical protein
MKYTVFCRTNRHCAAYLKMPVIFLLPKYIQYVLCNLAVHIGYLYRLLQVKTAG